MRVGIVVLCLMAAALSSLAVHSPSAPAAVADQRVGVYGYFWDAEHWNRLLGAGANAAYVVLNPESGPGSEQYEPWTDYRARARRVGMPAIGYVYTQRGQRSPDVVEAEARRFVQWYDVDGIFLDETPKDCATANGVVSNYVARIRALKPGIRVVANPGTNAESCYATLADAAVIFDGNLAAYNAYSPPGWVSNEPPAKFWHVVYGVPADQVGAVVAASKNKQAGIITVTDDNLPNPWDTIPADSYWSSLVSAVRGTPYTPIAISRPTIGEQRLGVPAFFGSDGWSAVLASPGQVPYVVLNPNNGAGTTLRPDKLAFRNQAGAAGIRVVGYLETDYSARPVDSVLAEIQRYIDLYDIDGIFMDEVTSGCAGLPYYQQIVGGAKARKASLEVVFNPGVNMGECFMTLADKILIFEGRASTYRSWSPSLWVDNYPESRFWQVVYATSAGELAEVVALSKTRRAGLLYVTNDDLPNPWDQFPGATYFDDLKRLATNSAPTPQTDFVPVSPGRVLDTRSDGIGAVGPGATRTVRVTATSGIPGAGVRAVAVNITATGATSETFVTAHAAGASRPSTSNLNVAPGQTVPNLAIVGVGTDGQIALFNQAGSVHLVVDVVGWFPTASSLQSITPARVLDTRDGTGTAVGRVGAGSVTLLTVAGRGGLPASGVASVVLNVTAAEATETSYVTVGPGGEPTPLASSLNFGPGPATPNLVIVKVGGGGQLSLFNAAGQTHLTADVLGWFPATSRVRTITPQRILDTRATIGPLGPGGEISVAVRGVAGIPADASAVVFNLTAVDPTAEGFVTAYPSGEARPQASSLNTAPGVTRPNAGVLKVGADGSIRLFNSAGSTHLVLDVTGYMT